MADDDVEYDVALSFAGEQRAYVDDVAATLRHRGIRPFYDAYEKVNLWGKDLYEHLDYVYQRAARFCVVFASAEYAEKAWTNHERRSAQARAIQENQEYILPARFDDTEIPGIRGTVGYIDLTDVTPEELAGMIETKLGPRRRSKFFPPVPDRLFEVLHAHGDKKQEYVEDVAREFYRSLSRMSSEERRLMFYVFAEGCPSELPANVHMSLDLLRRVTGMPPVEIQRMLGGMRAVGVYVQPREQDDHPEDDMIEVHWSDHVAWDDPAETEFSRENATAIARAVMLGASEDYCEGCALRAIDDLDFSTLSSVLATGEHRA